MVNDHTTGNTDEVPRRRMKEFDNFHKLTGCSRGSGVAVPFPLSFLPLLGEGACGTGE